MPCFIIIYKSACQLQIRKYKKIKYFLVHCAFQLQKPVSVFTEGNTVLSLCGPNLAKLLKKMLNIK